MESMIDESRSYPDLNNDMSIIELWTRIMLFHFKRMVEHELSTISGKDIEALHDMRVAIRRMRVAVNLFGDYIEDNYIKRLKKGLSKTGKSLGRVRDLDVVIGIMDSLLKNLPEHEIERVIPFFDFCCAKRKSSRKRMINYLGSNDYVEFKCLFDNIINSPEVNFRLVELDIDSKLFCKYTITSKYDQIQSLMWVIEKPTIGHLHKLRVAFKELRYTIEFFYNLIDREKNKSIPMFKEIQDHLGRINDIAVLMRYVKEDYKSIEINSLIDSFRPLQDEQAFLVATFPKVWQVFHDHSIKDYLSLSN